MGKGKLRKFQEIKTFNHVVEPDIKGYLSENHSLKGKWNKDFFKNENPIILELGCGKGEYSVGLAQKFPDKNFIGIDIKGARLWRGAKTSSESNLQNIAFLRTRIEVITSFFGDNEIDEIWITFPDPQMKRRRAKKRLTSIDFLQKYQQFLKNNGVINLKTDSTFLYEYTNAVVDINKLNIIRNTSNLYAQEWVDDVLSIKTHYEKLHIDDGDTINYISFNLGKEQKLQNPDFKEDEIDS